LRIFVPTAISRKGARFFNADRLDGEKLLDRPNCGSFGVEA
jgi:hypothetical protein